MPMTQDNVNNEDAEGGQLYENITREESRRVRQTMRCSNVLGPSGACLEAPVLSPVQRVQASRLLPYLGPIFAS